MPEVTTKETIQVLQEDIDKAIAIRDSGEYDDICKICIMTQAVKRMFPQAELVVTGIGNTRVYMGSKKVKHADIKYIPPNSLGWETSSSVSSEWDNVKPFTDEVLITRYN
jgi:hypothetical protein